MTKHFFENVYNDMNAEIIAHNEHGFTNKIEIHIHEKSPDNKYTFILTQKKMKI